MTVSLSSPQDGVSAVQLKVFTKVIINKARKIITCPLSYLHVPDEDSNLNFCSTLIEKVEKNHSFIFRSSQNLLGKFSTHKNKLHLASFLHQG